MKRVTMFITGLLMGILMFASTALSAAYPDKAITMIVPYSAGGSTDITARIVAASMEQILKQPVMVKNVIGAAGMLGLKEALNASPDGYTIGYTPLGPLVFQPHMRNQPSNVDDVAYIGQDVNSPYVVFVSKQTPWNTFEDMKKDLLAQPNKFRYGSSGAGTQEHIALADLFQKIGAKAQHVPFQSDAEKAQSMAGGHVQISAGPMSVVIHYDMRPLLVLDAKRLEAAPEVPTCIEKGLDVTNTHWHALFVPKGTPEDRVALLTKILKDISADPAYMAKLRKLGMEPEFLPPAEIQQKAREELKKYGVVIRDVILQK